MTNTIIINKDEFDFLQWYEFLTPDDIVELIDGRKVFEKYCRVRIRQIDIDLANMKYVDKEKQAYNYMECIKSLMDWIGKQINEYKQYTKELQEIKETKEEDNRSESDKQKDIETKRIKKKYKI